MHLELVGIDVHVGGRPFIEGLNLQVGSGRFIGLVGPNGSGKSTMLKTIYRVLRPTAGAVFLGDRSTASMSGREVARELAVMAQEPPSEADLTVYEMVSLGRLPYLTALRRSSDDDEQTVCDVMGRVGVGHLADRSWETLSGGEKQRVLLARAFAQQAPVLILDEPTNHLDIRHQLDLLRIVKDSGVTVVAALHDLNLAAHYCDEVVVIDVGAVVAHGPPDDVLVSSVLMPVFGIEVDRVVHPRTGVTSLLFSPRRVPTPADPTWTTRRSAATDLTTSENKECT